MELLVSVLIGTLVAILVIWFMNKTTSGFNSGLGERMEDAPPPPAPPPLASLDQALTESEPPFKRIKIENTDSLLIAVGLEEWHKPSTSIMDGAAPGSLAEWLAANGMAPPPTPPNEPIAANTRDAVDNSGSMSAPPPGDWTGGGYGNSAAGSPMSMMAPPPASAAVLVGGFAPAAASGPSPMASALAAWQAKQQVSLDQAAQSAQNQQITNMASGFKTVYASTWVPQQTPPKDTLANRTAFLNSQTSTIQASLANIPVSQEAQRATLMLQLSALQQLAGWASPAPAPAPAQMSKTPGVGPAAPPASAKYWGPQSGIDYPGNDLLQYPTSDSNFCAIQCDANSKCVGYVIATDSKNCWLKSRFANPTASSTRKASKKPGQPAFPGLPSAPAPVNRAALIAQVNSTTSAPVSSIGTCPPGYGPKNGQCQICGANYFSPGGTTACQRCPDGQFSAIGSSYCSATDPQTVLNQGLSCRPGYGPHNGQCQICGQNYFGPGGTTNCQRCPAGKTSAQGSTSCS